MKSFLIGVMAILVMGVMPAWVISTGKYHSHNIVYTGRPYHNIIADSPSDLKQSDIDNFKFSISKRYPQFDSISVDILKNRSVPYSITGTILVLHLQHRH